MKRQSDPVCTFKLRDGLRLALRTDRVESVMERDEGVHIVTSSDTYLVADPYADVTRAIWPDLFP